MFYLLAALLTIIDLTAKRLVQLRMEVGDSTVVRESVLYLTYYENSGAAFSSFQGYARLFGVIAVLFIIGVVVHRKRRSDENGAGLQDVGLAFLVAGAAGNGIERLYQGKVTDFLQFSADGGILNLADLFINAGVVILIVQQLYLSLRARFRTC